MATVCPTCRRPVQGSTSRRRRQEIVRQIYAVERQILSLEEGSLEGVIQHQRPAPACTICEQAAPGKPGEPTPMAELIRPLRQRLAELQRERDSLDRG